jgi:hypothetical protein
MIERLDHKLIDMPDKLPLGLADGKMGLSIYFFYMGRVKQNKEYTKTGERLLNDIWKDTPNIRSIDVKEGLAGIGSGISYLIRNRYVKGNANTILQDIDNEIFKQLSYPKYSNSIDALSLIHILYYLCERCSGQKPGSESEWLYRELIIQTVNLIYHKHASDLFEEPHIYTVDYRLPLFLFVLSRIYHLSYYDCRIIKILEEITPKLLSTFPLLHANRLFLHWGMDSVCMMKEIDGWRKHTELLRKELDINFLLSEELRNKNVYFYNGVSSIYALLFCLKAHFTETQLQEYVSIITDKIRHSNIWKHLNDDPEYLKEHIGLCNGYTGIAIVEHIIKENYW